MADMNNLFGVEVGHIVAGIAGGVVRALTRPGQTLAANVSTAVVGVLCAAYATPVVKTWLGLADADMATQNAIAFGLGLIGMSLAEGVISLGNAWARRPRLPAGAPAADVVNAAADAQESAK
ncbi:hypothetical protein ACFOYU_11740 [Microvirga sp. GCM10011540]|uniref:hypothetical protein n=1 Tax=Microvirga sp. GCM10011540 TaxID=3317338 RepID=UPI00361243C4